MLCRRRVADDEYVDDDFTSNHDRRSDDDGPTTYPWPWGLLPPIIPAKAIKCIRKRMRAVRKQLSLSLSSLMGHAIVNTVMCASVCVCADMDKRDVCCISAHNRK